MRFAALLALAMATTLTVPDLAELNRMIARFAPVPIQVDTSKLSSGDREALKILIRAAYVVDDIFVTQFWSGNHKLYRELQNDRTPLGRARVAYFSLNKSPWSALDGNAAFLPDVPPHKLPGANFYPENMTKPELEAWVKTLSEKDRQRATDFFSVIQRQGGKLTIVPYSREYRTKLEELSSLLRSAAAKTENDTLRRFLNARADAFLSDDYYASDVAWMDLDAPVDVTIGPYETYNDELFGYKASFEAYVNLRDDAETEKIKFFSEHLQEIENNLPIDPKYRNPELGALALIRVVNEIISTGDAAHGVRTAAYNLPNDERVIREKGSKRVMLKNVQEAKYRATLEPIASRVLSSTDRGNLSFDSFFTHILAHELTHGIGPHTVRVNGRESTPRKELKELYSAIEEAKADITGLFMLQYMLNHKLLPGAEPNADRKLYTTFLASSFRTLRFGTNEAHGKGMALQFNYLWDKGAFVNNPDGTFSIDFAKIQLSVRDLTHDLLTLEATGDYDGAKKMLDTLGVVRPTLKSVFDRLRDIPTDINPEPVTARSLAPRP